MSNPVEPMDCDAVRARGSLFLDGRLRAEQRARLQAHLQTCACCARELRDLAALGRVARQLPDPEPPRDLAPRVLAESRRRRAGRLAGLAPRGRTPVLVAAAALLLVGGFGYWLGARSNPGLDGPPLSSSHETFQKATDGLLADLRLVETLPPKLRRPLVQAQLDYFDLPRSAAQVLAAPAAESASLRPVATLVRDLDRALRAPGAEPDWAALRRRVVGSALRPSIPPAKALRPRPATRPLDTVLSRFDEVLRPAERQSLGRMLRIRQESVGGDLVETLEFTRQVLRRGTAAAEADPMQLPLGFQALRSLRDAGRQDLADALAHCLEESVAVRARRGEAWASARASAGGGGANPATQRLQEMMQEMLEDLRRR